jgi:hypothetical protein
MDSVSFTECPDLLCLQIQADVSIVAFIAGGYNLLGVLDARDGFAAAYELHNGNWVQKGNTLLRIKRQLDGLRRCHERRR